MRILFAADLHEPDEVLEAAERFAEQLGAELLVLHVSNVASGAVGSPLLATDVDGFGAYELYDPELEKTLEEAEAHAFADFLQRFKRPVRAAFDHGDPAQTILRDAEKRDADLILMGKRHHSALERFLLGSVTRTVVEHATRPTLLIPIADEAR